MQFTIIFNFNIGTTVTISKGTKKKPFGKFV